MIISVHVCVGEEGSKHVYNIAYNLFIYYKNNNNSKDDDRWWTSLSIKSNLIFFNLKLNYIKYLNIYIKTILKIIWTNIIVIVEIEDAVEESFVLFYFIIEHLSNIIIDMQRWYYQSIQSDLNHIISWGSDD